MNACKICGGQATIIGSDIILGRHVGEYESCSVCGFTFIRNPYWLEESYSSAIASVDIGSTYRCFFFSSIIKSLIHAFFNPMSKFVDYGAGYGLFVRRMRDLGYNYYWHDMHCENLFATGFDVSHQNDEQFELLSAFEVFEHLLDPVTEMEIMASMSNNIVFSTEIISRPPPNPGTWWYYAPEHGQHISFYTWDSLNRLARKFNLNFVTNGSVHMFSKNKINKRLFEFFASPVIGRVINNFIKNKSLLEGDFELLRHSVLQSQKDISGQSR